LSSPALLKISEEKVGVAIGLREKQMPWSDIADVLKVKRMQCTRQCTGNASDLASAINL
jgi:hypothetical protein